LKDPKKNLHDRFKLVKYFMGTALLCPVVNMRMKN